LHENLENLNEGEMAATDDRLEGRTKPQQMVRSVVIENDPSVCENCTCRYRISCETNIESTFYLTLFGAAVLLFMLYLSGSCDRAAK
jgi:hypothetical protein